MEHHIAIVKDYLKVKFKFLRLSSNPVGYIQSGARNQIYGLNQLTEYTNWNNESFLANFYKKYHLKISKVELVDYDKPNNQIKISVEQETECPQSILTKIRLYQTKETKHISDAAFQSLINAGAEKCPSLRNCKVWKKVLNSEFKIESNSMGSYVSPREKIEYYVRIFKDDLRIRNSHINIRLAGDGTQIGSNLSVLNFTFGFLDEIKHKACTNPNSVTGNFSLGMFCIKTEDYDDLKTALKEIVDELKVLKTIKIDGKMYTIELYLGGDLKFLALILGMF